MALISACDGVGSEALPEQSPTPTAAITPQATPFATESPAFAPEDEVLIVAIKDPASLDPMRIQDPGSALVARQLYEGLVDWDPLEDKIVPAAAESWQVSNGGRRFTFKLRPGMTFHDGTPVTSKDFAFALNRIALKENASDLAYTLERVEGFPTVNQLGRGTRLQGIKTPDQLTLVIELAEPYHDFLAVLTHPGLVPLPPRAVADLNRFLTFPIGNGPFQMAEPWTPPGDPVVLRAFVGFIDTPEIDGIRFDPYPEAAASWQKFLDGAIDITEVPAGQVEAAEESYGDRGFQPFLAAYYFGFNLRSGYLDDVRLRRAVGRAIDRQTIATRIYKGTLQPPRGIVPEGMPGFEENICLRLCDYAPRVAERLVDRLPRKARSITVEFTRGDPHGLVARAIAKNLSDVGFQVTVRGFGFTEYVRRLRKKQHGFYRLGWIAEYPTADVFLSSLFESDSPDNHFGFAAERVDALLRRAHADASENRRQQIYKQVEKLVLRQAPIVPIGSFISHWAAQDTVDGLLFDEMGGFDAVTIDLVEPES